MTNMRSAGRLLTFLFLATMMRSAGAWAATPCEGLAKLALPDSSVTLAEVVAAGAFKPPAGGGGNPRMDAYQKLPSFCRVAATLKPTSDSDIKVEVWLPASGWNGKLVSVGNGGWAGNISYTALATALAAGYATASTDTGHTGGKGNFMVGHPERLIDFGPRSIHEMTVKAKAVVAAYYGEAPKRSYFDGCSTGGRQALMEAQRYPGDFDGIVAGAPANNWSNQQAASLWEASATLLDKASYLSKEKLAVLHKGVIAACDAVDGVRDGVMEDPRRCKFDPRDLLCKGEDTTNCLTAPQAEAARKIYSDAVNPRTKQAYYPGFTIGSELGWGAKAGGPEPWSNGLDYFKYVVFKNPDWDWKTFDFSKDVEVTFKADNNNINALDPNLKPFASHGGKLLMYHGWSDPLIAPMNSINYYTQVVDTLGGASKASGSIRLFLVPGMGHCRGGDGTDTFDPTAVLDQWISQGKAPERIEAAHLTDGKVDRTRPLCPYPQTAQYTGSGSTNEAASFVCK